MAQRTWSNALMTVGLLIARTAAEDKLTSKRGTSYNPSADNRNEDYNILLFSASPINWYCTAASEQAPSDLFPNDTESQIEFVPSLPSFGNLSYNLDGLARLPKSSEHLVTFFSPDGDSPVGGVRLNASDVAQVYIEKIVPLRDRFQISHPSVTGSQRGLDSHWWGDSTGLAAWLDQLTGWYNQSGSGIEKNHAWFGAFRPNGDPWAGKGVVLFDSDGGLSKLGAYYLGGEANGFKIG
ncbi:glycosyl hydrolase catalytic core-domain-containing protein [Nemania sp. NC0429]|nr:glycosyl hydrolase catalytic core-domain-containing protein [Nemania sp. NC0429]